MLALGYELVCVAGTYNQRSARIRSDDLLCLHLVQPLLAFIDALVANPDIDVRTVDPSFEFHVPASGNDWVRHVVSHGTGSA